MTLLQIRPMVWLLKVLNSSNAPIPNMMDFQNVCSKVIDPSNLVLVSLFSILLVE